MKNAIKKLLNTSLAACLTAMLAFGSLAMAPVAQVQAAEEEKPQKTRRVPSMSEAVYKKLAEGQEAIDAKDYPLAEQVMKDMLPDSCSVTS